MGVKKLLTFIQDNHDDLITHVAYPLPGRRRARVIVDTMQIAIATSGYHELLRKKAMERDLAERSKKYEKPSSSGGGAGGSSQQKRQKAGAGAAVGKRDDAFPSSSSSSSFSSVHPDADILGGEAGILVEATMNILRTLRDTLQMDIIFVSDAPTIQNAAAVVVANKNQQTTHQLMGAADAARNDVKALRNAQRENRIRQHFRYARGEAPNKTLPGDKDEDCAPRHFSSIIAYCIEQLRAEHRRCGGGNPNGAAADNHDEDDDLCFTTVVLTEGEVDAQIGAIVERFKADLVITSDTDLVVINHGAPVALTHFLPWDELVCDPKSIDAPTRILLPTASHSKLLEMFVDARDADAHAAVVVDDCDGAAMGAAADADDEVPLVTLLAEEPHSSSSSSSAATNDAVINVPPLLRQLLTTNTIVLPSSSSLSSSSSSSSSLLLYLAAAMCGNDTTNSTFTDVAAKSMAAAPSSSASAGGAAKNTAGKQQSSSSLNKSSPLLPRIDALPVRVADRIKARFLALNPDVAAEIERRIGEAAAMEEEAVDSDASNNDDVAKATPTDKKAAKRRQKHMKKKRKGGSMIGAAAGLNAAANRLDKIRSECGMPSHYRASELSMCLVEELLAQIVADAPPPSSLCAAGPSTAVGVGEQKGERDLAAVLRRFYTADNLTALLRLMQACLIARKASSPTKSSSALKEKSDHKKEEEAVPPLDGCSASSTASSTSSTDSDADYLELLPSFTGHSNIVFFMDWLLAVHRRAVRELEAFRAASLSAAASSSAPSSSFFSTLAPAQLAAMPAVSFLFFIVSHPLVKLSTTLNLKSEAKEGKAMQMEDDADGSSSASLPLAVPPTLFPHFTQHREDLAYFYFNHFCHGTSAGSRFIRLVEGEAPEEVLALRCNPYRACGRGPSRYFDNLASVRWVSEGMAALLEAQRRHCGFDSKRLSDGQRAAHSHHHRSTTNGTSPTVAVVARNTWREVVEQPSSVRRQIFGNFFDAQFESAAQGIDAVMMLSTSGGGGGASSSLPSPPSSSSAAALLSLEEALLWVLHPAIHKDELKVIAAMLTIMQLPDSSRLKQRIVKQLALGDVSDDEDEDDDDEEGGGGDEAIVADGSGEAGANKRIKMMKKKAALSALGRRAANYWSARGNRSAEDLTSAPPSDRAIELGYLYADAMAMVESVAHLLGFDSTAVAHRHTSIATVTTQQQQKQSGSANARNGCEFAWGAVAPPPTTPSPSPSPSSHHNLRAAADFGAQASAFSGSLLFYLHAKRASLESLLPFMRVGGSCDENSNTGTETATSSAALIAQASAYYHALMASATARIDAFAQQRNTESKKEEGGDSADTNNVDSSSSVSSDDEDASSFSSSTASCCSSSGSDGPPSIVEELNRRHHHHHQFGLLHGAYGSSSLSSVNGGGGGGDATDGAAYQNENAWVGMLHRDELADLMDDGDYKVEAITVGGKRQETAATEAQLAKNCVADAAVSASAAGAAASSSAAGPSAPPPLPIIEHMPKILATVRNNNVVCIQGETGCGKSSMIPLEIYRDAVKRNSHVNIVVTQPRRLAARSLADRVASLLGESVGDTVGYRMGGGHEFHCDSRNTRIRFVTTGYLLESLIANPNYWNSVTHFILDEVHERSLDADMLSLVLKVILSERMGRTIDDLKLININIEADSWQEDPSNIHCDADDDEEEEGSRSRHVPERPYESESDSSSNSDEDSEGPCWDEEDTTAAISKKKATTSLPAITLSKAKIVVMSATIQAKLFQTYFSPLMQMRALPPNIFVGARRYPVQEYFLEDFISKFGANLPDATRAGLAGYLARAKLPNPPSLRDATRNAIVDVVLASVRPATAILVFLPGLDEIEGVVEQLQVLSEHTPSLICKLKVYPLHSLVDINQQSASIGRAEPNECNIIVATNIAETSLTIPDVRIVIDAGMSKRMTHEPKRNIRMLKCGWCSKSAAKQRSGRAGRVSNGLVIRMFSRKTFDQYMPDFDPSEFYPLEYSVLQVRHHLSHFGSILDVMHLLIEPPPTFEILTAIRNLKRMGALDGDELVTDFGRAALRMPVDLKMTRGLLAAAALGCAAEMVVIVAGLSAQKALFTRPLRAFFENETDFLRQVVSVARTTAKFEKIPLSDVHMFLSMYMFGRSPRNDTSSLNVLEQKDVAFRSIGSFVKQCRTIAVSLLGLGLKLDADDAAALAVISNGSSKFGGSAARKSSAFSASSLPKGWQFPSFATSAANARLQMALAAAADGTVSLSNGGPAKKKEKQKSAKDKQEVIVCSTHPAFSELPKATRQSLNQEFIVVLDRVAALSPAALPAYRACNPSRLPFYYARTMICELSAELIEEILAEAKAKGIAVGVVGGGGGSGAVNKKKASASSMTVNTKHAAKVPKNPNNNDDDTDDNDEAAAAPAAAASARRVTTFTARNSKAVALFEASFSKVLSNAEVALVACLGTKRLVISVALNELGLSSSSASDAYSPASSSLKIVLVKNSAAKQQGAVEEELAAPPSPALSSDSSSSAAVGAPTATAVTAAPPSSTVSASIASGGVQFLTLHPILRGLLMGAFIHRERAVIVPLTPPTATEEEGDGVRLSGITLFSASRNVQVATAGGGSGTATAFEKANPDRWSAMCTPQSIPLLSPAAAAAALAADCSLSSGQQPPVRTDRLGVAFGLVALGQSLALGSTVIVGGSPLQLLLSMLPSPSVASLIHGGGNGKEAVPSSSAAAASSSPSPLIGVELGITIIPQFDTESAVCFVSAFGPIDLANLAGATLTSVLRCSRGAPMHALVSVLILEVLLHISKAPKAYASEKAKLLGYLKTLDGIASVQNYYDWHHGAGERREREERHRTTERSAARSPHGGKRKKQKGNGEHAHSDDHDADHSSQQHQFLSLPDAATPLPMLKLFLGYEPYRFTANGGQSTECLLPNIAECFRGIEQGDDGDGGGDAVVSAQRLLSPAAFAVYEGVRRVVGGMALPVGGADMNTSMAGSGDEADGGSYY